MARYDRSAEEAAIMQFLHAWNDQHPGELIVVGELAQRLALTELEVHDALIALEMQGLVTIDDPPAEMLERDLAVRITAPGEEGCDG